MSVTIFLILNVNMLDTGGKSTIITLLFSKLAVELAYYLNDIFGKSSKKP